MLTPPPPLPALRVVAADEDLLEVIVGTVPVAVDVMAGEGTAAFKAPKSTSTPVDDELDEVVAGAPAVADVVAFVVVVVVRLAVATFVFDVFDILLPWVVLLTAAEVEVAVKEAAAEDEVVELALLLLLLLTFSLIFELVLLLVLVFFNLALAADATPLSNSSFAVVAGVGASVVV